MVITSPEAMVEFSGEKIKPPRSSKPFEHENKSLPVQIMQPRYAKNVK